MKKVFYLALKSGHWLGFGYCQGDSTCSWWRYRGQERLGWWGGVHSQVARQSSVNEPHGLLLADGSWLQIGVLDAVRGELVEP